MKAKTIKAILRKKHNEFVESIKDDNVKELVKKNSVITGGSIVSMLLNEPVNDYDYYFTDKNTARKVAEYYVEEFNKVHKHNAQVKEEDGRIEVYIRSEGVAGDPEGHEVDNEEDSVTPVDDLEEEKPKYQPVFLSTNAISLSGKIQLVMRFYGDADEIHENYDFIHATCYWRSDNGHLSLPRAALEAILTKELIYTGSKYPLCSIFRAKKFIKRGWYINAGQYLKMALQLNKMNLLDINTLKEQLTGVDATYFQMIINNVEGKKENDADFELTNNYLFELINRIF